MIRFIDYIAAGVRDSSGDVLAGGQVQFYAAGTTTAQTVYEDYEKTIPHTNPLTLDAYGRANVWADGRVKAIITDASGSVVRTLDDIGGIGPSEIEASDIKNNTITPSLLSSSAFGSVINGTVKNVSSDLTILDDDGFGVFLVTTGSSSDVTITLPTASANTNREMTFKKVDSGTNALVLDGEGSETIDGATTYKVNIENETVTLSCNGIGWYVTARHAPILWQKKTCTTDVTDLDFDNLVAGRSYRITVIIRASITGTDDAVYSVTDPDGSTEITFSSYFGFGIGTSIGSTTLGVRPTFTAVFTAQASGSLTFVEEGGAVITNGNAWLEELPVHVNTSKW